MEAEQRTRPRGGGVWGGICAGLVFLFSEKFLRATQSVAHCFAGISSTFFILQKTGSKTRKP